MSVTELLEKVKALSADEKAAFASFFHQLEAGENGSATQKAKAEPQPKAQWPDLEARRRRILGDRILPENIVLAARREERW
mgnify:FL=1